MKCEADSSTTILQDSTTNAQLPALVQTFTTSQADSLLKASPRRITVKTKQLTQIGEKDFTVVQKNRGVITLAQAKKMRRKILISLSERFGMIELNRLKTIEVETNRKRKLPVEQIDFGIAAKRSKMMDEKTLGEINEELERKRESGDNNARCSLRYQSESEDVMYDTANELGDFLSQEADQEAQVSDQQ